MTNKNRTIFAISLIIFILNVFTCSESLPTYVEPEVPIEFKMQIDNYEGEFLYPPFGQLWFEESMGNSIYLFNFRNLFDETLSVEYFRRGYLDIWLEKDPTIKWHYEFFENHPNTTFNIDPQRWYNYGIFWDYSFDDGSQLYEHLDFHPPYPYTTPTRLVQPITIRVKGEIQISRRFNKFTFEEIEYNIYFITYDPVANPDLPKVRGIKRKNINK